VGGRTLLGVGEASASVDAGVSAGSDAALASAQSGDFSGDAAAHAVTVGAQVAAAAGCTAVGFPELAPLCATVAGKIVGPIAESIGGAWTRAFGGPLPAEIGFAALVHAAPHIQEAVIENFVSLGQAQSKLVEARALAGLPYVDPFDVLRYLGADLVPTDTAHPYVEPPKYDAVKLGASWNYTPRPAGGGEWPDPSDPAFPLPQVYQWGHPWMPPDFHGYQSSAVDASGRYAIVGAPGAFATISYQTMGPDEIRARLAALDKRIAAWRRSLLTAAMVGMVAIGTEAAAVETARQIEALAAAKREADARGQLVDLGELIALGATIAKTRATLDAYGLGVTDGVTFLRTVPRPSAAEGLATLTA
jgi:hypothetical protein